MNISENTRQMYDQFFIQVTVNSRQAYQDFQRAIKENPELSQCSLLGAFINTTQTAFFFHAVSITNNNDKVKLIAQEYPILAARFKIASAIALVEEENINALRVEHQDIFNTTVEGLQMGYPAPVDQNHLGAITQIIGNHQE